MVVGLTLIVVVDVIVNEGAITALTTTTLPPSPITCCHMHRLSVRLSDTIGAPRETHRPQLHPLDVQFQPPGQKVRVVAGQPREADTWIGGEEWEEWQLSGL